MAIHNYVDIYAVVRGIPVIKQGDLSSRVLCPVSTIRGTRDHVSQKVLNQYKYSSFFIMTEDKESIQEISGWKELDIVRVTGFIATLDTDKKAACPNCGTINRRIEAVETARSGGNIVYVYPIYARKMASYTEQGMAFSHLIENAEISNRVFLMGNLTRDPEKHELVGKTYTRFQLAINRKYCAKGLSYVRERTDFPWIYSYGENAEKDFAALRTGASVFVDGAIQTRRYKENYKCSECGESFPIQGRTLEIVAYATEYLSDCDFERLEKYGKDHTGQS